MDTELLKRKLRILHLEDNPHDHMLVAELLRADGLKCDFTVAKTEAEFTEALGRIQFDLIISDHTLPSYDGLRALSTAQKLHGRTPFVFFSGTIGEDVAVDSLRNGAVDYVLKQRPNRLIAAVRRALRNAAEHIKLEKTEGSLRQSEERLRIIAKATNDVVWEWDMQTDEVWFSENFQAAFGHENCQTGITSDEWFDFIHPDDKSRVLTSLSTSIASAGRVWWSEYRMRRHDGSYAHIFDRASIIYNPIGKSVRVVGIKVDVSERKQAGEKIREQAELLNQTRDAIIVCAPDRTITFWNYGAEQLYGWTAAEAMGRNVQQLMFPVNSPPQVKEAEKSLAERGEWMGELQAFTKSGAPVIVQQRSTLIYDEQGNAKSILFINTDITAHKQLEEQFLRSQRLESLGVLVSGIAHDLNNTLVPIIIGVEILAHEKLSEEARSMIRTMETSARRSAEMIRQMLTFARGGQTVKSPIRADMLVKEMGKIITDTFSKSIHCTVRIEKNIWLISGIPTQIHQVLMNLCVNARDAMPEGGTLILAVQNAELSAKDASRQPGARPGKYVCIRVADTGTGISPEQMGKIFQPFFTTKAPGKGTGLGLSTSQSIIKNHNGFITVDSRPKEGTEFKVYLPCEAAGAVAAGPVQPLIPPDGRGERILVVDDEESILAITRTALENYGYLVATAASGLEAVARFREDPQSISLVITDHAMPFMDGNAIIALLRKIRPDIKVILTSGSEEGMEGPGDDSGADGFVPKPFTTEKLLNIIHDVLTK
jgi:PAS domain S-box-containing protein